MKTATQRKIARGLHLGIGALIATYIYSPWGENPAFQIAMKAIAIPVLVLSGLWLWKGHLLRRKLSNSRKVVLVIFCILTTDFSLTAQTTKGFGGSGHFTIGYQHYAMKNLNQSLQGLGYNSFRNANIIIGGGGQGYIGRWVVGAEGGYIGQRPVKNSRYHLDFGSGFGVIQAGYIVVESKALLFYPTVGGGFSGTQLEFKEKRGNQNFNAVAANPFNYRNEKTTLSGVVPLTQVALNADLFLVTKEAKKFGPMIGFIVGYRYSSALKFKTHASQSLESAPEFDNSGLFATMRFGGGYRRSSSSNNK